MDGMESTRSHSEVRGRRGRGSKYGWMAEIESTQPPGCMDEIKRDLHEFRNGKAWMDG
jgi:hypothetical protein